MIIHQMVLRFTRTHINLSVPNLCHAQGEASDKADQEDLSTFQKFYLEMQVASQIMTPVQDTRRFVEKEAKIDLCLVSFDMLHPVCPISPIHWHRPASTSTRKPPRQSVSALKRLALRARQPILNMFQHLNI